MTDELRAGAKDMAADGSVVPAGLVDTMCVEDDGVEEAVGMAVVVTMLAIVVLPVFDAAADWTIEVPRELGRVADAVLMAWSAGSWIRGLYLGHIRRSAGHKCWLRN